ncbi:MAG: hypothetical protein DIU71_10415 [Proteobacteria bacterium]|nr:MAG: hypothetical protein DIU71_10415 [Pseudomonadota bacterium]
MTDCWIVDLGHYLTPNGAIAPIDGRARQLAEYWTSIVVHATANFAHPPPLPCRRRPGREACGGHLDIHIEADSDAIHWSCPACRERGLIRGWQGTLWDGFNDPPLSS